MSQGETPSKSGGNSGSSSQENGEDSEDYRCPFCSQSFSYRGAHGHLRMGEGVSAERARELIRESKKEGGSGEVETGRVESEVGGSVGGRNESAEVDDRSVGDLGPAVQHVRRRVEDVSDAKAAMKLLEELDDDGGDDRDSAEIAELRGELRALRSQMSESGGSANGSGGSGEIGRLADMASKGDVDPETVGMLASAMGLANPEVKRQEVELEKTERRIEHREELIDTVARKVEEAADSMDGSLLGTLVEGLFSGGGRERRSEATVEPRSDARGDRGDRGERSRDGREKSGEAVKSSAQERFEEMAESDGGEEREIDEE